MLIIRSFIPRVLGGNKAPTCTPAVYGLSPRNPGASCKDILGKSVNPESKFGYYIADVDVNDDGDATTTVLQVYCDMTTDGGGWLGVAHLKATNDFEPLGVNHNNLLKAWPPQPEMAEISKWDSASGKLVRGTAIGAFASRTKGSSGYTYSEVRFKCTGNKGPGIAASVDIKSTSPRVFEFFTGATDVYPDACASEPLPDDDSALGQVCAVWGSSYDGQKITRETQTWGIHLSDGWVHNPVADNRLYQFPMWVYGKPRALTEASKYVASSNGAHFSMDGQQNRFECDNFAKASPGNEWMVFIR